MVDKTTLTYETDTHYRQLIDLFFRVLIKVVINARLMTTYLCIDIVVLCTSEPM